MKEVKVKMKLLFTSADGRNVVEVVLSKQTCPV